MINVFFSILPIFLLILTGFISKKTTRNSEAFWELSDKFVYYLFFPALLILDLSSTSFNPDQTITPILSTLLATLIIAIAAFSLKSLLRLENKLFTSVFQGGTRYNSYVFIALSQSLFGSEGVALSGIFVAYMIIATNIISVLVLNKYGSNKKDNLSIFKSLAKNPLIIAAATGCILSSLDITISNPTRAYMTYLANAATPLSLMSVGAGLLITLETKKLIAIGHTIILKLVAMPILTFLFLKLLNASGAIAGIAMLYASMPTAGNAYILARQMGGDAESMASIITWTTVTSIVTITFTMGIWGIPGN
ncbi:AEC family transporter [Metapseudomonas otitidis]|uniref:AEC family transporter n=1 Tax=Metapseudomonas otitidis TaxID=319939 RepID=UPI001CA3C204|nr:AEC family transporter [Pseudomonas otitidis]QZX80817.1 AEC family transporter [Pseudomonas otitidis]